MFTGKCPFKGGHDCDLFLDEKGTDCKKTMSSQNQLISTLTARAPLPFAKFILNLMEVEGLQPCCHSAEGVGRELKQMLSDLEHIVSNSVEQTTLGSLHFLQNKLYGRDSHLSKLMDACSGIFAPGGSKMVLVSGYSGVGKSSIVEKNEGKKGSLHIW